MLLTKSLSYQQVLCLHVLSSGSGFTLDNSKRIRTWVSCLLQAQVPAQVPESPKTAGKLVLLEVKTACMKLILLVY